MEQLQQRKYRPLYTDRDFLKIGDEVKIFGKSPDEDVWLVVTESNLSECGPAWAKSACARREIGNCPACQGRGGSYWEAWQSNSYVQGWKVCDLCNDAAWITRQACNAHHEQINREKGARQLKEQIRRRAERELFRRELPKKIKIASIFLTVLAVGFTIMIYTPRLVGYVLPKNESLWWPDCIRFGVAVLSPLAFVLLLIRISDKPSVRKHLEPIDVHPTDAYDPN